MTAIKVGSFTLEEDEVVEAPNILMNDRKVRGAPVRNIRVPAGTYDLFAPSLCRNRAVEAIEMNFSDDALVFDLDTGKEVPANNVIGLTLPFYKRIDPTDEWRFSYSGRVVPNPTPVELTRQMPWVDTALRFKTPGVGCFHLQSVGSALWSAGFHVFAHPDGQPDSLSGHLNFRPKLSPTLRLEWEMRQGMASWSDAKQRYLSLAERGWTPQVLNAINDIFTRLPTLNPQAYAFEISDMVHHELHDLHREKSDLERSLQSITDIRDGRKFSDLTDEQIEERLEEASARLALFEARTHERVERLSSVKDAITTWRESSDTEDLGALVNTALTAPGDEPHMKADYVRKNRDGEVVGELQTVFIPHKFIRLCNMEADEAFKRFMRDPSAVLIHSYADEVFDIHGECLNDLSPADAPAP